LTASSRIRKEQPMGDENPMGQVIQIDEARIRDHLGEMVRGTVEETLNAMLDLKQTSFAGQDGTSAAKLGRIPALAAMIGRCRPALARSISKFRSCDARPLRRRSSSATADGRARSRKR
jgi:hypothetical protein